MGFFSSLIKLAAPIAGAIVPGIKPVLAAAGLGATFAGAEALTTSALESPAAPIAPSIVAPGVTTAIQRKTLADVAGVVSTPEQVAAARRASVGLEGPRGRGQVVTMTFVERRDAITGALLTTTQFKGSPYLMNSEVASLRKTVGRIRKLEKRLPKKTAKISEARIDDRVEQIARTGNQFQALLGRIHHGHNS